MWAYYRKLSPDKKAEHTAILIVQLCNWAAATSRVQDIIKLPLDGLEEQARYRWSWPYAWRYMPCSLQHRLQHPMLRIVNVADNQGC